MSDLFDHGRGGLTQEHRVKGKLIEWRSLRMDLTAKVVCKKCNETWMSDIETRIKSAFSQIMRHGPTVSILQRGVSLLAALAFEKAVVADHLHMKEDPFFDPADRHRFRESLVIPGGVQIWLAAFQGRGPYRLYFNRSSMFDLRFRVDLEVLSFTYVAGHLVIQLLASKWKDKLKSGRPLPRVQSNTSFDAAVVQCWPPDGFPVSWPPSEYFNDKTIPTFAEQFAEQFDGVMLVRHRRSEARKG